MQKCNPSNKKRKSNKQKSKKRSKGYRQRKKQKASGQEKEENSDPGGEGSSGDAPSLSIGIDVDNIDEQSLSIAGAKSMLVGFGQGLYMKELQKKFTRIWLGKIL